MSTGSLKKKLHVTIKLFANNICIYTQGNFRNLITPLRLVYVCILINSALSSIINIKESLTDKFENMSQQQDDEAVLNKLDLLRV